MFHGFGQKRVQKFFLNPRKLILLHQFLNSLIIELVELIPQQRVIIIVILHNTIEQSHDVAFQGMGPLFVKDLFGLVVDEYLSETLAQSFVELFLPFFIGKQQEHLNVVV